MVEEGGDTPTSHADAVARIWLDLDDEGRRTICRTCSGYFPQANGVFECLKLHTQNWRKPCKSYSHVTFRLCDDWVYTPRQTFIIRKWEDECKKRESKGQDEDDDD